MVTAFALWVGLLGIADEKKPVQGRCPVDGFVFKAWEVTSQDHARGWGGIDRDFCHHAFKTTPLEFFVWTCPSCHFTGVPAEFKGKALFDEDRRRLLKDRLRPLQPIGRTALQENIPGDVKYDLLAQTLEALGEGPARIGAACLNAAWCARQKGAPALDAFDEWAEIRSERGLDVPPLELGRKNRTDHELEAARRMDQAVADGEASAERDRESIRSADGRIAELMAAPAPDTASIQQEGQRRAEARGRLRRHRLRSYMALFLWRRHGECDEALRAVEALRRERGDISPLDEAVEGAAASIERERVHLKRAADHYEKAIQETGLKGEKAGEGWYLLGEMHRRIGDKARARAAFDRALEVLKDGTLKGWAGEQRKLVE